MSSEPGAIHTCFYNDAYSRSLGPEHHPGSLGLPALEVWREIWPVIGPQIEQVMNGGEATWHENALVPITRFGRREDVYWTYGYSPIADDSAASGVGGVLVVCTETTPQVIAEQRLEAQIKRERQQFEQAPGFICVLVGPDHVYQFVNQAYRRLIGDRDFVGRPVREVAPELSDQGFFHLLDGVYATGERHVAHRTPIRLTRAGVEVERFLDFIYEPMFDDSGRVSGIFVEGYDMTGEHLAQQAQQRQARHLELLVDELNHRVKNTLAIVQGLAHQTFKGKDIASDAKAAFDGRLMALASAHDLLTKDNWEGARLDEIAMQAVAFHGLDPERYSLSGPPVDLAPGLAVNVAMILHELSTNAYKYGSLSTDSGTVHVAWSVDGDSPRRLSLEWAERDGPRVSPPAHNGFGSTMIMRMAAADPGSEMGLHFEPTGVVCRVKMDLPEAAKPLDSAP
jgi:two-component sensor histidine kinase